MINSSGNAEFQSLFLTIEGMQYETFGIIGEGGQGVVYLAKDENQRLCAIKMIRKYNDPIIKDCVDNQIKIQKSFDDCPYVIQILGVEKERKVAYIAIQLGQYTLKNCTSIRSMNQTDLVLMLCHVLQGLHKIHKKGIMHRDIKPENIIYQEGNFKITDFGISTEKEEDDLFLGTYLYMPPQVLFHKTHTYKMDLWSLGVTAFETYFKINPFYYEKKRGELKDLLAEIKRNILALTPQFTIQKFLDHIKKRGYLDKQAEYVEKKVKNTSQNLLEKLFQLLEPNPEKREDTDYFFIAFNSLKMPILKPPKITRILSKYKREELPFDLEIFCKAKDLFYELNSQIKYEKYEQTLFALELGVIYLQGRNHFGKNFVVLDQFKKIKQYKEPPEVLCLDVKNALCEYFFYLQKEEENNFFDKINELRFHILICSVYEELQLYNKKVIEKVRQVTELNIQNLADVFNYFYLFTEKSCKEIEKYICDMFYTT